MFSEYRKALDEAESQEARITAEYENKREALTLKMQEKMKKEASRISKEQHLKDYNPVAFANSITKMKHQHDEIVSEEKEALGVVKTTLDNDLSKVSDWVPPVTELYKIISCAQNSANYVFRVWFTLIPVPEFECVPGDPIRVEWVQINTRRDNDIKCAGNKSPRTGPGYEGLQICNFQQKGFATNAQSFYNYNSQNDQQKQWWREWIEENRPIPKEN